MKKSTYLLTLVFLLTIPRTTAASPKIGDKAPAVNVAKWITEKPPALPGEKGTHQRVFSGSRQNQFTDAFHAERLIDLSVSDCILCAPEKRTGPF